MIKSLEIYALLTLSLMGGSLKAHNIYFPEIGTWQEKEASAYSYDFKPYDLLKIIQYSESVICDRRF